MMIVSGVREILTWLDVPEKFVILHARTLYFGICSSIREKISTSSASELQRSNECTNRNCLLENPPKTFVLLHPFILDLCRFILWVLLSCFRNRLYHMTHKGTADKGWRYRRRRKKWWSGAYLSRSKHHYIVLVCMTSFVVLLCYASQG